MQKLLHLRAKGSLLPMWILLGLAGLGEKQRTPQYKYWSRPQQMDDCGQNLLE
jgi:hypothetical protein